MQTIDAILSAGNLIQACRQVMLNKGAAGVDAMNVKELKPYMDKNRNELTGLIRKGEYYPQPIRGKEIPKSNNKKRLLGIPTVVDRMLQQAVVRIIMPQYEYMFSEYSMVSGHNAIPIRQYRNRWTTSIQVINTSSILI